MTRITKGLTYRHRRMTEVDMHILSICDFTNEGFTLEIVWVNRFQPHILNPDTVFLRTKDLPDWSPV